MMKLVRFVLPLLMLSMVVSTQAQGPQEIVVVNGKKCVIHTIAENETFYSLAQRYDVPLKQIIQVNGEESAEKLALGMKIYIPYNEKVAKRSTKDVSVEMEERQMSYDGDFIIHIVAEGETLYSVAKNYKISLDQLVADNPTSEAHSLMVGSELLVRTAKVGYATIKDIDKEIKRREREIDEESKQDKPKYHVVAYGDTLYSLARRYKTTEEELMALNSLTSSADLLSGMTIMVHGTKSDAEVKSSEVVTESVESEEVAFVADTLLSALASDELNRRLDEDNKRMIDSLESSQKVHIPSFERVMPGDTLNVVVMLPVHRDGKIVKAFVDLYRGVLLAFQDLRREGYAINVSVVDTQRSAIRLSEIVESQEVQNADLIIGPIYEDELAMVLPVAEKLNIPVVNPLTDIDQTKVSSPVLFQMQADAESKYDKYANIFDGSYEINIIYGATNDMEYVEEILAATGDLAVNKYNAKMSTELKFYKRNADGSDGSVVDLKYMVQKAGRKAIIVVADRDYDVGMILKGIGEHSKYMPQGGANDCYVIGSRKLDRLTYVDREGFFTSGISLLSPYNSKRTDNNAIKLFESRFLQTFGILPTPYACRGYDATMMFCTKMFSGLDKYILLERITPLGTTYQFVFDNGMFVNTEWVNIQYMRDFTVTYK